MSYVDLNLDLRSIRDARKVFEETTGLLKDHLGYTDPAILGSGSFGIVFRFRLPQSEDQVAVKCVLLEDLREGEENIWIELSHPNIVPLLQRTTFEPLNVACFEMHVYPQNLMTAVQQVEYLLSSEALRQLKRWLYQVLCGLDYLHMRQLCHLDIKADNIFISRRSSRAMIGDFTFLSRTTVHIGRDQIGLPLMYQPPEASWVPNDEESIDGRSVDLWSYGMMSFELLTAFHMVRSSSCRYLPADARYLSVRCSLQEDKFTEKMKIALPSVEITQGDIKTALNFLHSFLIRDPSARLTAAAGMQHEFLGREDFENENVNVLGQIPNTTDEGTCRPIDYHHQAQEFTFRQQVSNWFRRRFSALRSVFTMCLPCMR